MAAADYRLLTEATGVRIAEALEDVTAMVGPKGDPGDVSEMELTAKLADKASAIVDTASGAIASFPDGAAVAAKDVTIGIEPVQSGSGDPSPTNVRPISGWTGANVVVSPTTDAQDGITYPISWQSEAGTVYGGTLDVTTGLLTVDRAIKTINGGTSESWGPYDYAGGLMILLSSASWIKARSAFICDNYGYLENVYDNMYANRYSVCGNHSTGQLFFRRPYAGFDFTVENWKSWLASNPITIAYIIKEPIAYSLTPTEVEMLLGENNVWADTGDSTVIYRADTKLYIEKINAPTDDDMIADAQIASGKYFIVGGNLYKSTTTIPAGDTITPGTNCILTNLADALNALNT